MRRNEIGCSLRILAPRLPAHEFEAVVGHALTSARLKSASAESAAWLSLVAYARHVFTDYDELLSNGYDRESARFFVRDDLAGMLQEWGVRKPLSDDD
jgi:hypothetical protein